MVACQKSSQPSKWWSWAQSQVVTLKLALFPLGYECLFSKWKGGLWISVIPVKWVISWIQPHTLLKCVLKEHTGSSGFMFYSNSWVCYQDAPALCLALAWLYLQGQVAHMDSIYAQGPISWWPKDRSTRHKEKGGTSLIMGNTLQLSAKFAVMQILGKWPSLLKTNKNMRSWYWKQWLLPGESRWGKGGSG